MVSKTFNQWVKWPLSAKSDPFNPKTTRTNKISSTSKPTSPLHTTNLTWQPSHQPSSWTDMINWWTAETNTSPSSLNISTNWSNKTSQWTLKTFQRWTDINELEKLTQFTSQNLSLNMMTMPTSKTTPMSRTDNTLKNTSSRVWKISTCRPTSLKLPIWIHLPYSEAEMNNPCISQWQMIKRKVWSFNKTMRGTTHRSMESKHRSCTRKTYIICRIRFSLMKRSPIEMCIFQLLTTQHP